MPISLLLSTLCMKGLNTLFNTIVLHSNLKPIEIDD